MLTTEPNINLISIISLIDDQNKVLNNCLAPLTFSTYKDNDLEIIILLYIARIWKLEPKPIYHSEIKWVKPKDLRQYKMPPANDFLISSLQDLLI